MGARTGNPRGRPSGSKNRRTREVEEATAEIADKLSETIENAFEGDAHTLLMAVYKDPAKEWSLRIDAAKAAIRYEKPALASVSANVDVKAAITAVEWRVVDPSTADA